MANNALLLQILEKLKALLTKLGESVQETLPAALQDEDLRTVKRKCERLPITLSTPDHLGSLLDVAKRAALAGDVCTLRYFHQCWLKPFLGKEWLHPLGFRDVQHDLIVNAIMSGDRATMLYVKNEIVPDFTFEVWMHPYLVALAFEHILDHFDDANILRIIRIVKNDLHVSEFPSLVVALFEARKFGVLHAITKEDLLPKREWKKVEVKGKCLCRACKCETCEK